MKSRQSRLLTLFFLIVAVLMSGSSARAVEERATNFIFLVDVSGSMLSKSTMVTAADGKQVTLFEALRVALQQVVQDKRLIGPVSKVAFITFGTNIEPKNDWPAKLATDADRQALLAKISSPETLQADKHGDTYMGGALSAALTRANAMFSDSDPCTSTFIVMLTDGWDEPPHGANLKVRDVAAQLKSREQEIRKKTGYETWHVMVVGLQRLPDRKSGTTTAKELAEILGGEFMDVSKQSNGTVSDRIVASIKTAVDGLQGSISFQPVNAGATNSVRALNFGTVGGDGNAKCEVLANLHSCYGEDVTAVTEVSHQLSKGESDSCLATCHSAHSEGTLQSVSKLPPGALTVKLMQPEYQLAPAIKQEGATSSASSDSNGTNIGLIVHAGSNCPAGYFAGALHLASSAKTPKYLPYVVSVPGRLVADPEELHVKIKKPGFFFAEPTSTTLEGSMKQLPGSNAKNGYDIVVHPQEAQMNEASSKGTLQTVDRLSESLVNEGKPVALRVDPDKTEHQGFKMNVAIPAKQTPGTYKGKLKLDVHGEGDTVAPTEIPFDIEVLPSAWEHVAPVAIPIGIIFVVCCGLGIFLWIASSRRN